LGFGTVGRALHALLERRRADIAREYGVELLVTGVASRRLGWRADANGVDAASPQGPICNDLGEWVTASRAALVFEAIALEPQTGQPALDYLRVILDRGVHVVSANKGPVVHGYRELTSLARARGVSYHFESAVMDGAPVFSLVRECLPLAGLSAVRGIFTSTATVVLEAMERGATLAEGIAEAQRLGIAEADPAYDVDGWDSAVKLCALANVLLDGDIRPNGVVRAGLGELSREEIRAARDAGSPIRLVGSVERTEGGSLYACVEPMRCAPDGPFGIVRSTTLVTHYEADVFPGGLTVTSRDPDPTTTAYGMLADMVRTLRER